MRRSGWTPSIVPNAGDQTVYLVESDFGRHGHAYVETDTAESDLESVIRKLISGEYLDPIRIVSFNTAERWSQDVSEDIAREIRRRHDIINEDVPSHVQEFVERFDGRTPQLALRLV